jgi:GntR family transcriptional regulator/MocR family aminotransferase
MPQVRVSGAAAGLHLIAWLPQDTDEQDVADSAAQRGVALHTLHHFCAVSAPVAPALILGYGLIAEPAIPTAVRELSKAAGN